ncbi:hypothetical protein GGI07_005493 [Coemansia sp. Benny D115]|nr:hypothetical protein GGI07_005493 [Coemansia sp. Benny D115]
MYAAPNKASAATKISRDANYPPASKPIKRATQQPKTTTAPAANGAEHAPAAEPSTQQRPAEDPAALAGMPEPAAAAAADADAAVTGLYLAPGSQRGPWSASRLFAHSSHASPGALALKEVRAPPVYKTMPGDHPLLFAWTFWFMHRAPGQKIDDYESAMIQIATFSSVESFWTVYSHLKRPDRVPTITDYHLFRAGVRPVWEDPANVNGGKWMIRLKKGLSPRLWEKLAMGVVGDAFGVGSEICGIVLSIRNSEDIISLWNRSALDTKTNNHIRDIMKSTMGLPTECAMEYKAHNDSLKDNSSFRNTDVYK